MPIQVIVSEINRTCSTLNIRANSAKWTEFLNLSIYITHDSIDAQIEKARSTILGVVCRGHTDPNTSFHKFVPVTKGDLEAELRSAHPLLTDTTFMEGPDWTRRPGSMPDDEEATANVSFVIPDHREQRISELTKQPITLFFTQCRMTKWVEKINMVQYMRCWKFRDKVHPACQIRCRQCGGNHEETDNSKECMKCSKADIDHEDQKKGLTISLGTRA